MLDYPIWTKLSIAKDISSVTDLNIKSFECVHDSFTIFWKIIFGLTPEISLNIDGEYFFKSLRLTPSARFVSQYSMVIYCAKDVRICRVPGSIIPNRIRIISGCVASVVSSHSFMTNFIIYSSSIIIPALYFSSCDWLTIVEWWTCDAYSNLSCNYFHTNSVSHISVQSFF